MPKYTRLCNADEIAPGAGKTVHLDGRSFAIFNQGGKYFVIDDVCPHRGGSLGEGPVDAAGTVACPWHGWRFNIATGQSPVNPTARVPCFNARVESGWVEAEI
jgi:nitrite reductase (NADH) small subunit